MDKISPVAKSIVKSILVFAISATGILAMAADPTTVHSVFQAMYAGFTAVGALWVVSPKPPPD